MDRVREENHGHSGDASRRSVPGDRFRGGLVHDHDDNEADGHGQGGDPKCRLTAPAFAEEEEVDSDLENVSTYVQRELRVGSYAPW